jgi:hypothetical protein
MQASGRWRELLDQRLGEAVADLGTVPGVRGLIVGGSLGRGQPWPLSDIDLVPVYAEGFEPTAEVKRRHAALIDWWASSGRAQTLDVGWLAFSDGEVAAASGCGPAEAAAWMADRRWLHGVDKAFGGRAATDPDGLARMFLEWIDEVRFDPLVVAARVGLWRREATVGRRDAEAAWREGDATLATARAELAPVWLRERIDLAAAARRLVGEQVTPEQNARDQLVAYATHVPRHRPDQAGPWMAGAPERDLPARLAKLDRLMAEVDHELRA